MKEILSCVNRTNKEDYMRIWSWTIMLNYVKFREFFERSRI